MRIVTRRLLEVSFESRKKQLDEHRHVQLIPRVGSLQLSAPHPFQRSAGWGRLYWQHPEKSLGGYGCCWSDCSRCRPCKRQGPFFLEGAKKKCLLPCIIYKYLQIDTRHDVTRDFFKSPIETMLLGFAGEFELAQLWLVGAEAARCCPTASACIDCSNTSKDAPPAFCHFPLPWSMTRPLDPWRALQGGKQVSVHLRTTTQKRSIQNLKSLQSPSDVQEAECSRCLSDYHLAWFMMPLWIAAARSATHPSRATSSNDGVSPILRHP